MNDQWVQSRLIASLLVLFSLSLLLIFPLTGTSVLAAEVAVPKTLISGTAMAADGGPLQGMVAVEVGRLYGKNFRYGGQTDSQGRFLIEVPKGGDYGLHLYASGYIYFPVGVEVKTGQDNRFRLTAAPNSALAEAPVLSEVKFAVDAENPQRVIISLKVNDRNENLSHQVLGINIRTQEGMRLRSSKRVFPWTRNYPNGTYRFDYATHGRPFDPDEWLFVAADNRCYTSSVLGSPFTAAGILPARSSDRAPRIDAADEVPLLDNEPASRKLGQQVFAENCAVCHYADKTTTRVGPGLKGLFKHALTPVEKIAVTPENIRQRIQRGGENMPPYGHIREPKLSALLIYLQSL